MLEGYFDESGSHDATHMVLSGFIAETQRWARFGPEWSAVLASPPTNGYQPVPFFKAQWFSKRKEFFAGWTDEFRLKFMRRLLRAIQNLRPIPVSAAMPMREYGEIVTPGPIRNRIGSAYTLCALKCFALSGTWAVAEGRREAINYFFDAGHRNRGEFSGAHRKAAGNPDEGGRFLVGHLSFEDERNVLPLQAADLIAYEMAQYLNGKQRRHPLGEILKFYSQEGLFDKDVLSSRPKTISHLG